MAKREKTVNGQKRKDSIMAKRKIQKETNNDLQNTTQKAKD